jgi:Spy/CpxP family protein refolding chaperone
MLAGATALVVALVLVAASVPAFSQPGQGGQGGARRPGGEGGRGMMGTMMYLERTWTAVSFQLDCTGEQLASLRPTYRNTLAARDAAVKAAAQAQDWQAMGKAMQDSKTRLDAKLKEVLSNAQWQKLQQLMQPRMGGMRPGGGAPGGGR